MKAVVMITVVDMEAQPEEDVIASVSLIAKGNDPTEIAADASNKAFAILGKQELVKEKHNYHVNVNILGMIPTAGGKEIIRPSAAAAQAILKSGEIVNRPSR